MALADLGIADGVGLMLVAPPDGVLAEAGRRTPRPSFASGIMTAEPTDVIAWWPEAGTLTSVALARLCWMVATAKGHAWLVLDPREGVPPVVEVALALEAAFLRVDERRDLGHETALRVSAAPDAAGPPSDAAAAPRP